MTKRRIALVVPGLEEGGGVPVVARFLYEVLARTSLYEPHLISLPMGSADPSSLRLLAPSSWIRGVEQRQGTWSGMPFLHIGSRWAEIEVQRHRPRSALTRVLREYDLVQVVAGCPSWAMTAVGCGRPVGLQVATLLRVERAAQSRADRGLRRWVHPWMTRLLTGMEDQALRAVDRVFVENDWMFDHVSQVAGSDRVVFAPPGIDTEFFTPPAIGERRHILSVGRMSDPRKNVTMLFEAYAALREMLDAPPPLVLAGNQGPTEQAWSVADRLGIRNHVEFHQNVSQQTLRELYRQASVYALSSDEEGLGLVILEAMACGCPVVSTDCGGPTTSVLEGETGFLVPVGDVTAFANRLRLVLEDPRSERMGALGRNRAVESFSMEATGRRFVGWYDEILG